MNFNELQLMEPILKAVNDLKYENPSKIQEKTIPYLLERKDVLGCAQTGSGKTAAFSLPMIQLLMQNPGEGIRGLIMTPTRELAMQICENIRLYSKYTELKTAAIYGGVDQESQIEQLEAGVDIVAATPGRLLDLMKQGYVSLAQVKMLVLDEADRMLDMGFVEDILFITRRCPKDCQKLMFSATMPKSIERLGDRILTDPETIMQDEVTSTGENVNQYVYYVDEHNKLELLSTLLKGEEVKKAIVFTNTRNTAELVSKHLMKLAIRSRAIHSEKSQNSRQDAILQFANNKVKVLVATDVAARGIDINKVTHVFNYDIPERAESYIHRIGRTGRAGEEGTAINLVCIDQMDDFRCIERYIKKTIPQLKSEWPMTIFQKKPKKVKQKEEPETADPFDIKKVKDVSLSGKPVKKKSSYQYYQKKFGKDGSERSKSYGQKKNRSFGNGKAGAKGNRKSKKA